MLSLKRGIRFCTRIPVLRKAQILRAYEEEQKRNNVGDCLRAVHAVPAGGSMQELADAALALAEAQEAPEGVPDVQVVIGNSSNGSASGTATATQPTSRSVPAPRQRTIQELYRGVEKKELDILVSV